ncbi:hypothetical protein ASD15_15835 [Massilia sp. Root351]|jgi:plasmid stabilization system protein ParE|uniref:type II toxin-antitoxin system RelE/ParE family toxin n=1 Tax=Massilia sp. Root351 TaxID=1736522 RepID=UPI0007102400|nr:type II toxin-antitoxin system RelE/ParE family toxin [Massilia sp. Root351]KQV80327.1 hypothetical protein ASD15_15835 [Massilia sp. Root351]
MAQVVLMPTAESNVEQIFEYFASSSVQRSAHKITELTNKLSILEHAPLLGRPLPTGQRELLIGDRRHTYAVRYQYDQARDTVFVLSIRSSSQNVS